MYEAALEWAETTGPAWEDLTNEQRAAIRETNDRHMRYMDNLGRAIAAGNKRPLMRLPKGVSEPCGDCDPTYGCTMNCSGPVTITKPIPAPPKRGKKK